MNLEDLETASLEEMVDFYNANSKRKVKQFNDRPTAVKRVGDLITKLAAKEQKEAAPELTPEDEAARQEAIREKRRAGTSRSWGDPEVRAKRIARHGVEVDGVYYSSVAEAFRALDLPMKKCIEFRGELKRIGEDEAAYKNPETGEFYHWKIVPFRKAEGKKKVKPETESATEQADGGSDNDAEVSPADAAEAANVAYTEADLAEAETEDVGEVA